MITLSLAYNIDKAVTGVYPDFVIDYPNLLIATIPVSGQQCDG
jgi:hypothetical protein